MQINTDLFLIFLRVSFLSEEQWIFLIVQRVISKNKILTGLARISL